MIWFCVDVFVVGFVDMIYDEDDVMCVSVGVSVLESG